MKTKNTILFSLSILSLLIQSCITNKTASINFFSYSCVEDFYVNDDYKNVKNNFIKNSDTNRVEYEYLKGHTKIILYSKVECEKKCIGTLNQRKDTLFLSFNILYPQNNLSDSNCDCAYKVDYFLDGLNSEKKYYIYFVKPQIIKTENKRF